MILFYSGSSFSQKVLPEYLLAEHRGSGGTDVLLTWWEIGRNTQDKKRFERVIKSKVCTSSSQDTPSEH